MSSVQCEAVRGMVCSGDTLFLLCTIPGTEILTPGPPWLLGSSLRVPGGGGGGRKSVFSPGQLGLEETGKRDGGQWPEGSSSGEDAFPTSDCSLLCTWGRAVPPVTDPAPASAPLPGLASKVICLR